MSKVVVDLVLNIKTLLQIMSSFCKWFLMIKFCSKALSFTYKCLKPFSLYVALFVIMVTMQLHIHKYSTCTVYSFLISIETLLHFFYVPLKDIEGCQKASSTSDYNFINYFQISIWLVYCSRTRAATNISHSALFFFFFLFGIHHSLATQSQCNFSMHLRIIVCCLWYFRSVWYSTFL